MIARDEDGKFTNTAWPGGYPVYHLCGDGEALCAGCANGNPEVHTDAPDDDWRIIGSDVNWEDAALHCAHCHNRIPSAYAED
jgi:hypothetical protein